MKKIIAFFNQPLVNIGAGFLIWLAGGFLLYVLEDDFSSPSAWVGALATIGVSIYGYGVQTAMANKKKEK